MDKQAVTRLVDIAGKAGVSRRTVSSVLLGTGAGQIHVSDKTAQRVRRIALEMNYQPNIAAQQLAGKRSAVIGLIVENMMAPAHPAIIQGIESRAVELGYKVIIGYTQGRLELLKEYLEDFSRRQVEGLICLEWEWGSQGQSAVRRKLFDAHPNVVTFGNSSVDGRGSVEPDRQEAAAMLVKHLFECGRNRIGLLLDARKTFSCEPRRRGYIAQHEAQGRPADGGLIFQPPVGGSIPPGDVLDAAIEKLVVGQRADAIIPYDDFWAVALIKHLKRRNLSIPGDIAVAGFGNYAVGTMIDPELTTVDMHLTPTANRMVEMLDGMINDTGFPAAGRKAVIQPTLVVRASTGSR